MPPFRLVLVDGELQFLWPGGGYAVEDFLGGLVVELSGHLPAQLFRPID
jgi:hypothetical protein